MRYKTTLTRFKFYKLRYGEQWFTTNVNLIDLRRHGVKGLLIVRINIGTLPRTIAKRNILYPKDAARAKGIAATIQI